MNAWSRRLPRIVWGLTAVYWIGLFVVTHLPPSRLPQTRIDDKLAHFISYAILTALLLASLQFSRLSPRAAAWWTVAVLCVYAAVDELLQIPVGRICSLQDWLADVSGVITVAAFTVAVQSIVESRRL